MRPVPLALIVVLALPACTAGRASFALVQAQQAVRRAQAVGAEEHAVYELTMAEAYLAKAREEASFSSYKTSVDLARTSADWADKAIIGMERAGTGGAASRPGAPPDEPEPEEAGAEPAAPDEAIVEPAAPEEAQAEPNEATPSSEAPPGAVTPDGDADEPEPEVEIILVPPPPSSPGPE